MFIAALFIITKVWKPRHGINRWTGMNRWICDTGISLVVQWLRLHTPNAGGLISIPGQGTSSHMPQLKDSACLSENRRFCAFQLRPSAAKKKKNSLVSKDRSFCEVSTLTLEDMRGTLLSFIQPSIQNERNFSVWNICHKTKIKIIRCNN